jgi:hypothetical protein
VIAIAETIKFSDRKYYESGDRDNRRDPPKSKSPF